MGQLEMARPPWLDTIAYNVLQEARKMYRIGLTWKIFVLEEKRLQKRRIIFSVQSMAQYVTLEVVTFHACVEHAHFTLMI